MRANQGHTVARGLHDDAMLEVLTAETAPATVVHGTYRHAWQPGDLVLWDNRVLVHAAVAFDASAHERHIYRAEYPGETVYFW